MPAPSAWGGTTGFQEGAAATAAKHAQGPRAGRDFHGASPRQRRADLAALHYREIWFELLVLAAARLSVAVPADLRNRPLCRAHRREYFPRVHPAPSRLPLRFMDFDDTVVSLVRRLCRRRRNFSVSIDELSRRLVTAQPDIVLGLRIDGAIPRRDSIEQGHLSIGRNFHVGGGALYSSRFTLGRRQWRSSAHCHRLSKRFLSRICPCRVLGIRATRLNC
jgi:hypothetical protein